MSLEIVYGDICETDCDVLVNASNGIGYMGGKAGIRKRLPGVAESAGLTLTEFFFLRNYKRHIKPLYET